MPQLAFDQSSGEFILFVGDGEIFCLSDESLWTSQRKSNPAVYTTRSLKAAMQVRDFADNTALRVFIRTLMQYFDAPRQLPRYLDPIQREGVKWILSRSRSYLAHAPGAGKTVEAITAANLAQGEGPVLFIVPPSLTLNWLREYGLWGDPTVRPFLVSPDNFSVEKAEVVICPDSLLARRQILDRLSYLPWKLVAVDEASRFKDSSAARSIALFGGRFKDGTASPGLVRNARYAVLLDGSPMPNRSMELWAPTYAMAPEVIDFMSREEFGFRYCGATQNERGEWEFKHSARHEELKEKLTGSFMHIVTEDQLGHPERKRALIFMNENAATREMREWTKTFESGAPLTFSDSSKGDIARMRRELGLKKVPWVAAYTSERLDQGEAVLLFTWHREVSFALEARLKRYQPGLIMGGTYPKAREERIKGFQKGRTNLLILNIGAAGRGHNIQRADRGIFAEFAWSDETNKQAEKRFNRRGSLKLSTKSDYIIAPQTFDEVVMKSVFRKSDDVRKVIG